MGMNFQGYSQALAEIKAQLDMTKPSKALLVYPELEDLGIWISDCADGRDVIEPAICTIAGDLYSCRPRLSSEALKILNNERCCAACYPLDINSGFFFSEVLGPRNNCADQYQNLIADSLRIILDAMDDKGQLPLSVLDEVGQSIQDLDAAFAQSKINQPEDCLHRCYGPNPNHPYSKITLCRTTLPILAQGNTVSCFFEKYLVAYSYFDEKGRRQSTTTPIHTHPLNFETVYFTSYGHYSQVEEQEFHLIQKNGSPVIGPDGKVDPEFIAKKEADRLNGLTLVPGIIHTIRAANRPATLPPFESEAALRDAQLFSQTDGLFRPHRVTVYDDHDADRETLYYALDNYFGPAGKVLLFEKDGRINLWSHDNWCK